MKISTLGPKGTFSDVCVQNYLKSNKLDAEVIFFNTIDECVNALEDGKVDNCIVPIENTLDGYVQRTLDLLLDGNVFIIDSFSIPVQFKLVYSCKKEDIKIVYGQFKAVNQCYSLLNRLHNSKVIETESNMISYEKYKENKENSAAIVPIHIDIDNEDSTIDNIADSNDNFTRFILLKKKSNAIIKLKVAKKVVIPIFVIPEGDRPGLLFDILQAFAVYKINLISIISRPTKVKMGTYNFYLEVQGNYSQENDIINCLNLLKRDNKIKILGEFSHN